MAIEQLQFTGKSSETISTEIDGVIYRFRIRWNTTDSSWNIDIYDADGDPIILSRKLFPPHNITYRYSDERLPQNGDFWCYDTAHLVTRPTYESLGDTFFVAYVPKADLDALGFPDFF